MGRGVCSSGVMLVIFSLVYLFLYTSLKNHCAEGVCKTLIILADLLLMYCFFVHRVANLRRSIRIYQTLGFHS